MADNVNLASQQKGETLLTPDGVTNKVIITRIEDKKFSLEIKDMSVTLEDNKEYLFYMEQVPFDDTIDDIQDFEKDPTKYAEKLRKGHIFDKEYNTTHVDGNVRVFEFELEAATADNTFLFNQIFIYNKV
jgi:hypothetical protein